MLQSPYKLARNVATALTQHLDTNFPPHYFHSRPPPLLSGCKNPMPHPADVLEREYRRQVAQDSRVVSDIISIDALSEALGIAFPINEYAGYMSYI